MSIYTLRGYLKSKNGINYRSFRGKYGKKIRDLPVTIKVLLRKNASHFDDLEIELKEEGWLLPYENLFEIISSGDTIRLRLGKIEDFGNIEELGDFGDFPETIEDAIPLSIHCMLLI